MITTLGIASVILNIILLLVLTLLLKEYFKLKKQVKGLAGELENESLEFYLKEIKKRGFDFTLKPKKQK